MLKKIFFKVISFDKYFQSCCLANKIDTFNCYSWHFFLKFIYFWEGEREKEEGTGREREGQRIWSSLCADSREPDAGLELMNPEVMTWAEIKSRRLNWLSHPGTPTLGILNGLHWKYKGKWYVSTCAIQSRTPKEIIMTSKTTAITSFIAIYGKEQC